MSTSKKWQLFACLVPLVLGLDQATKLYVHTTFALHESRPVIDNLFAFTYVRNSGAAFGMLARQSETFLRLFFPAVTVLALTASAYLFRAGTVTVYLEAVGNLSHHQRCAREWS